jgi:uncharacterized protein (TIGR02145 family)
MSSDSRSNKGNGINRKRTWKYYVPLIIIAVVIPVLIWLGSYVAAEMSNKIESREQTPEHCIKTFPAVTLGGETYNIIAIDSLAWLAENLNYNAGEGVLCFDHDTSFCEKYGRLYTYDAASKACEEIGWRLPSKSEWDVLNGGFGTDGDAYEALVKGGKTGFDAVLGGAYTFYDAKFEDLGLIGHYWSSTEFSDGDDMVWTYAFRSNRGFMSRDLRGKKWALSCRCVKPLSTYQNSRDENKELE